jgi:hypothetical protein
MIVPMKKGIISLTLLTAVLATVSCHRDYLPSREIAFGVSGEVSPALKTKADAVTALSSFHVGCVTGTVGSDETEVFNAVFTETGPNNYTASLSWPLSDPGYKFYASSLPLESRPTGCTVSASTASDLVCAVLPDPVYMAKGTLVFRHVFGRIGSVTVSADEGYTVSDVSVRITPKVSGTYDLFAGDGLSDGTGWSGTSDGIPVELAPSSPGTRENDLFLVPGTYVLTASWKAAMGDYVETFTGRTVTVSVPAGKVTLLKTTFGGNARPVEISVTMLPWEESDETVTL